MRAGVLRTLLACAATVLLAAGSAHAQELPAIPKLEGRANDLTGTLTAGQQAEIEQKLKAFEQRKGAQIALLVVNTVKPDSIEGYGIRVMDAWKLGRAQPDDGALLLVALQDRELRIEVADGLEGALTDGIANRIIVETITPLFRQGDVYSGINAGLDQIIRVVDGEPLPAPDSRWQGGGGSGDPLGALPFVFFGVVTLAHVIRSVLGRGLGALATAGAAGGVVWLISHVLPIALFAGIGAFIYALMATNMRGRGGSGGWRGGGFGNGGFGGWGGGGSSSGGGGFSGGGGHSSGGGASGRW